MNILQPKFIIFFVWMLIVPAGVAYFGGYDTNLDFLFFMKALGIAWVATIVYFLIEKRRFKNQSGTSNPS